MTEPETHVAGLVVHAYPDATERVAAAIVEFAGAQVHASSADGKLVVTLEADGADAMADFICRIQTLPGVLAAALVYQHSEDAAAMDEEMDR